ncbi:hypothetical protein PTI97_01900 [Exiguobacterium marinum]|uniref:Uncharacterized protein n=1 Tax=Exiguobacterium marinum TaxID=273528 RepID=A0ABY7X324_9BACL|nr:hypothetical protein [Exiguobacterium marinum]WDH76306.1 hypothetical protein PTI97_01900 [Exiguobacterium marinum]
MTETHWYTEETTWRRSHLRVGYALLVFVVTAIILSFFGRYVWLTIPFVLIGITMIGLDVKKYRMRRTHMKNRNVVRLLKWNLLYDLISSGALVSLILALLIFQYDSLALAIGLLVWGVVSDQVSRTFQQKLNERVPLLHQLDLERRNQ